MLSVSHIAGLGRLTREWPLSRLRDGNITDAPGASRLGGNFSLDNASSGKS
jgi:hypothetical protein